MPGSGQFFTTHRDLQEAITGMCALGFAKDQVALEPSAGRGDLVGAFRAAFPSCKIHAVELDPTLGPHDSADLWIRGDFLHIPLPRETYNIIFANPPYVRGGHAKNLYIRILERCFSVLADNGELIAIVPPDFFTVTSAASLLKHMDAVGRFTHVFRPKREDLFENASVAVMVIRYERSTATPRRCWDTNLQTANAYSCVDGTICIAAPRPNHVRLDSVCTVHVGLVTGCDAVFKNEREGNVSLLTDLDQHENYILAQHSADPLIATHLLPYKERLKARRIRQFNATNWFEWGALRNRRLMEARAREKCVFVRVRTRDPIVAFEGQLEMFGHKLLAVLPKPGVQIDLAKLTNAMNSKMFQEPLRGPSGRFSVGQRLLGLQLIPAACVL